MPTLDNGCFCWFECASTDAAGVKPFYTGLFDWNSEESPMPGDQGGQYTTFRVGAVDMAGLYQMSGPHFEGVPSHWATYVKVESADEVAERAMSLGGKIVAPVIDVPGIARIAFLQDPTGASVGVFEPGGHPGLGEPETSHGSMGWSLLTTTDTAAAKAFYCELFGWTAKQDHDGSYSEFQRGGRSVGGMLERAPDQQSPPNWLPYVAVDDCDVCSAKVSEHGGKTLVPPTDVPPAGRFSVFADPAGAHLAFIQLARSSAREG